MAVAGLPKKKRSIGQKIWHGLAGRPARVANEALPFDQDQINILKQLQQAGPDALQNILKSLQQPVQFNNEANNALTERDYYTKDLPALQERLYNLGGTTGSSGYAGTLGGAGAGLRAQLSAQQEASQRAEQALNYQRQGTAAQIGQNISQLGLAPRESLVPYAGEEGGIQMLLNGLFKALPSFLGGSILGQNGLFGQSEQQGATNQEAPNVPAVNNQQYNQISPQQFNQQFQGLYDQLGQRPLGQYAANNSSRFGETPQDFRGRQLRNSPGLYEGSQRVAQAINSVLLQQHPNLAQSLGGLR